MPPASPVSRSIRLLFRLGRRRSGFEGKDWSASIVPDEGSPIFFVDGFASSSSRIVTSFSEYIPWLEDLDHSYITHSDRLHGFSYSRPGKHYGPRNTNIQLKGRARVLFRRYAPSAGRESTYVAFSFGGPLTLIGLLEAMELRPDVHEARTVTKLTCPLVVLVQPALCLSNLYLASAAATPSLRRPTPVREFLVDGETLWQRFLECLARLHAREVRVVLLYWSSDVVLSFSEDQLSQIREQGAVTEELDLTFEKGLDPFEEHCLVRSHIKTQERLAFYLS